MGCHIANCYGNVSNDPSKCVCENHSNVSDAVDWRLLPTLSFLYLMCSLDKANAGNAKVSPMSTIAHSSLTHYSCSAS